MGRHGGGSRSGGGGSRSSSSSRSGGGSSSRSSSTPFTGSYNRSYYDRRGRYHSYYTTNARFGMTRGWNIGTFISLLFVTVHMLLMMGGFGMAFIEFGGKVDGDINRIQIVDTVDTLTTSEENEILKLFNKVYEESGMPVTLYTDDFDWKEHYNSLEVYSEELYYQMGYDEDAMIILFTENNNEEFYDWEYDFYCGDDTIKCLSDTTFDKLLANFQKAMANENLAHALDYSWNSVMDDLAKIKINSGFIFPFIFMAFIYGIFYISLIGDAIKEEQAYKYFKENGSPTSENRIKIKDRCPTCGAINTNKKAACDYCGTLLEY
jgi:hypothetical protein